jgi:hypothetical protein
VSTFIPPWNAIDLNMVAVLRELKFDCISDDWKVNDYVGALSRIPQTAALHRLSDILDRHAEIPPGSLIVVLFHRYDFASDDGGRKGMSIERLQRLLKRVADRDDLVCMRISDFAIQWRRQYTASRHRAAERYVAWASFLKGLPGFEGQISDRRPGILFPESYYAVANTRLSLLCGLIVLGALLLGGLLGRGATRLLRTVGMIRSRRIIGALALAAVILLAIVLAIRLAADRTIGVYMVCACVFGCAFFLLLLLPARPGRSLLVSRTGEAA